MPTTQSAYDWLRSRAVPEMARRDAPEPATTRPGVPDLSDHDLPDADLPDADLVVECDGRAEVDRLRAEIEDIVAITDGAQPRDAVDSALDAVARLQVVTANLDACNPPGGTRLARALVELADQRLRGHADAIERGMTYTSDNIMRQLRNES